MTAQIDRMEILPLKPQFSIIIPAYNVEPYIGECLDSVLGQGRDDVEVIVVNDGSTDSTASVVEGYMSRQSPVVLINQMNKGQISARQAGISAAGGDYILCVDGDDGLLPGALDALSEVIEEYSPDCIMFGFTRRDGSLRDGHIHPHSAVRLIDRPDVISRLAGTRDLNSVWSKCAHRVCMGVEGDFSRFERLRNGEDLVQSIGIIERSRSFAELDAPLYYYRPNAASVTSTFREADLSDVAISRGEVHAFLQREGAGPELERAACAVDYMQAVDIAQSLCLSSTPRERALYLLDDFVSSDFFQRAVDGCGGTGSLRADYRAVAPLLARRRYRAFCLAARARASAMSVHRTLRGLFG